MTKQLRFIITLTICSLTGILALQVYFGVQVYRQYSVALERDVDRALTEALSTAERERLNQISQLFARDIRNPALVALTLNLDEEVPRIFVADPATGDTHVSIRFRETIDTSRIKEQLIAEIISYNRNFLEEGSVMYWTDTVGKRLGQYTDSIQIDKSILAKGIRRELDSLAISSDFEVILSQDSTRALISNNQSFPTRKSPILVDGFNTVMVKLDQPGREVLRRTGFIYLMAAVIFLLIVSCFVFLLHFVRRQKRLSLLKDEFIDNVTHELLTPITTLKLALETMRQYQTSPTNKYLDLSEQQAQRIAEVVDHILQVSFVDEKHAGLQIEKIPLRSLLKQVVAYHEATCQQPLEINTVLPDTPYLVYTDRKHLSNVFHNLVGNAIKYGPENGIKLKISVTEHPQSLQIDFTDSGPGIPAHEHKNIFKKFHRVNDGHTHEVSGLGIGLYYARGIMEQLDGSLSLVSSSASGTTFSLTLPYQTNNS